MMRASCQSCANRANQDGRGALGGGENCNSTVYNMLLAAVVIIIITIAFCCYRARARHHRDRFDAKRSQEIYNTTRELFDKTNGSATYSDYKTVVHDVDPVVYTDLRSLWKNGKLSADEVKKLA